MKRSLIALTLAAALPFAASAAEGVTYNYVEAGYQATNGDIDADGVGVNGSFSFHPNFHVFGGYSSQEIDDTSLDVDQLKVGLGYNLEISPRADLLARVAYQKLDAGRVLGTDLEFDGWSTEVGVRGSLARNFDGYALAGYEDYDGGIDGDFYGRLGANLKFNPNWGINGDVKFAGGDTEWFVGPRFTW
ncbi:MULTISPECIES: diffusible signal factor-reguated Ax21 faimly protein [unclassified Luteimonas]|uniref:outer membrane beta-barrel protein n=1 Tax=unclassified Luteimonas TaxID=2629088 RepID=UPI0015FF03A9|nr:MULTISPECIES: diffusible signal factor-reguated Ax21 faimly protein [unclassified Luteimonas]MBB1473165.1 Ax21 family protein [Luteimonas sp. MC1782]MBB6598131.1 Ax21 family protein [Luteimonas sp. MC1825]QOC88364.1 Ax21 family protein [Luteimonas sp. MC1825]